MNNTLFGIAASAFVLGAIPRVWADLTVLDEFDPSKAGGLCSVGFDHTTGNVWVYDCFATDVQSYSSAGVFLSSIARPGEIANDVDIEFAPEALTLGSTPIPAGTLLFINGETDTAEIYAVDKSTGTIIETLNTDFGVSHVVGGAYHPDCDTFFLIQDNVPAADDENRVAEVDPTTGQVLSTFQVTSEFSVSFGDIEVSAATGNIYLVSSVEPSFAEFTVTGLFVQYLDLPAGVGSLSGIGLDDAPGEAWVGSTGGVVWRLGGLRQQTCVWDLDGNGDVGVTDLLSLLGQWGLEPCGPPDFDGGGVGVTDLLKLLGNWGPCP